MKFQLPKLPWGEHELDPFLSAETIESHYLGHHKTYIDKVNATTEKLGVEESSLEKLILNHDGTLYDNAAQAWNHTFYWYGLSPTSPRPDPNGELMRAVNMQYGSFDGLRKRFLEFARSLFGSGWTWMVVNDEGELNILNTHNADNPIGFGNCYPLWVCDIWEHAYYLDYRYRRNEYLEAVWDFVDWSFVESNLVAKRIPNMSKLMLAPAPNAEHSTPSFI